jgi:hypothetical protein
MMSDAGSDTPLKFKFEITSLILGSLQVLLALISALNIKSVPIEAVFSALVLLLLVVVVLRVRRAVSENAFFMSISGFVVAICIVFYANNIGHSDGNADYTRLPFVEALAFVDRPQGQSSGPNGRKDAFERAVVSSDRLVVEFIPDRSRQESKILNNRTVFYQFDPGERILVKICGQEQEIQTYPKDHAESKSSYQAIFAVPESEIGACLLQNGGI